MTTRTAKLSRHFDSDLADKQIEDRFRGQLMFRRGMFEAESRIECERIYSLPSSTELDCAAQAPTPEPQR
jgi:hypothetical protein